MEIWFGPRGPWFAWVRALCAYSRFCSAPPATYISHAPFFRLFIAFNGILIDFQQVGQTTMGKVIDSTFYHTKLWISHKRWRFGENVFNKLFSPLNKEQVLLINISSQVHWKRDIIPKPMKLTVPEFDVVWPWELDSNAKKEKILGSKFFVTHLGTFFVWRTFSSE